MTNRRLRTPPSSIKCFCIYQLDLDRVSSARALTDTHLACLPTHIAQVLSIPHIPVIQSVSRTSYNGRVFETQNHLYDGKGLGVMSSNRRASFQLNSWIRVPDNYRYLYFYWLTLLKEYKNRTGRDHGAGSPQKISLLADPPIIDIYTSHSPAFTPIPAPIDHMQGFEVSAYAPEQVDGSAPISWILPDPIETGMIYLSNTLTHRFPSFPRTLGTRSPGPIEIQRLFYCDRKIDGRTWTNISPPLWVQQYVEINGGFITETVNKNNKRVFKVSLVKNS